MIIEYKSIECCKVWMSLKTSYYVSGENGETYFVFQCKDCGKIIDCTASDLDDFAQDMENEQ